MEHILRHVLAAGLTLACLGSAHAASLGDGAAAGINYMPTGDSQSYNTFNASDLLATHVVSAATSGYGSSAYGSVSATAGLIDMNAYTHVVNPLSNGCTNCSMLVAQQNNSAAFTDALHLTSTTLAVGTPVDLLFTLPFSQTISASEALSMYLDGGYFAQFLIGDQHGNSLQLRDDGPGGSPDIASAVLHTFVGDAISLNAFMAGGTYAEYYDSDERSITANATASFYADAVSPGVTMSADSGHIYATPAVPEPATTALLLAGMGFVGWAARRRGRMISTVTFNPAQGVHA